ncbi:hypothetical protein T08_15880, partial [Trichinella sp. T8]
MLLGSRTLPGEYKSSCVCFRFPLLLLKSHHHAMFFLQYLGKCAFMKREIKFWKVPRQTN